MRVPKRGDVYALRHRKGLFAFARVVLDDVKVADKAGFKLLTFSAHTRGRPNPPQDWSPPHLAMRPVLVDDSPWRRGHAQFVTNLGLLPHEDLSAVTFAEDGGGFVDAEGERMGWAQGLLVPLRVEPWAEVLERLATALKATHKRDATLGPGAVATGPRVG